MVAYPSGPLAAVPEICLVRKGSFTALDGQGPPDRMALVIEKWLQRLQEPGWWSHKHGACIHTSQVCGREGVSILISGVGSMLQLGRKAGKEHGPPYLMLIGFLVAWRYSRLLWSVYTREGYRCYLEVVLPCLKSCLAG